MGKLASKALIALLAFSIGLSFDMDPGDPIVTATLVPDAEARIGRPATPLSYAGVARRTTRRVIRRSTIYVATLPRGCASVTISGAVLWQCGATYYQAEGSQYVVVYVD